MSDRPFIHAPDAGPVARAVARVGFAIAVWISIPGPFLVASSQAPLADRWAGWRGYHLPFENQDHPNGLAHFFDFTWLSNPEPVAFGFTQFALLRLLAAAALVVYLGGRLPWLVLPYLAAFLVAIGTLNNSQGSITHHYQAVAMTAVALAVFHVSYRIWIAVKKHHPDRPWRGRWELFVGQQGIAAAYVVSAISKIKNSWGGWWPGPFGWVVDAQYFPAQIVKTEQMHYYNSLVEPDQKSLPLIERMVAPVRDLMMDSVLVTRLVLGSGVLLELLAFLILLGPRWNVGYALVLILFHLVVGTLMSLHFTENLVLLTAFFIAPVLVAAAGRWSRHATSHARPKAKAGH